jgi:hypothetical protein
VAGRLRWFRDDAEASVFFQETDVTQTAGRRKNSDVWLQTSREFLGKRGNDSGRKRAANARARDVRLGEGLLGVLVKVGDRDAGGELRIEVGCVRSEAVGRPRRTFEKRNIGLFFLTYLGVVGVLRGHRRGGLRGELVELARGDAPVWNFSKGMGDMHEVVRIEG